MKLIARLWHFIRVNARYYWNRATTKAPTLKITCVTPDGDFARCEFQFTADEEGVEKLMQAYENMRACVSHPNKGPLPTFLRGEARDFMQDTNGRVYHAGKIIGFVIDGKFIGVGE